MDVDLTAPDQTGTPIPLVVANMTAISGRRMAETVARRGAIAVIPQDIPLEIVADVINWVKSRHLIFDTPVTLNPNETVADAIDLITKRAHGALIVVEDDRPIGIITEADCENVDRFTQLHKIMSKDLVTLNDDVTPKAAFEFLTEKRRRLAPVIDKAGKLVGIITRTGALRATMYQPAIDANGKLKVSHTGALPGMLSKVTLYPDLNLGIVILTNTENGGEGLFSAVTNTIADSYLGLDDHAWIDKISAWRNEDKNEGDSVTKKTWEQVASVKNSKVKNENFIGIYADQWFGKVAVFEKNKQLWIKCIRSPKLNGPMALYNDNTFAIKWEYQAMNCDAFAMFTFDETGKAQAFKMKGISPNIDFSFDFQDLDLKRVE